MYKTRFNKPRQNFVVSEPELQAACNFLNKLPPSSSAQISKFWSQERLLNHISDAITPETKIGSFLKITCHLWAIIKPIGIDITNNSFAHDTKLQVWLITRPADTDPEKFIEIKTE